MIDQKLIEEVLDKHFPEQTVLSNTMRRVAREVLTEYAQRAAGDAVKRFGDETSATHYMPSPAPEAAPIQAHSKSQYKRLDSQGANVVPPADGMVPVECDAARYQHLRAQRENLMVCFSNVDFGMADYTDALVGKELDAAIDKAMLAIAPMAGKGE